MENVRAPGASSIFPVISAPGLSGHKSRGEYRTCSIAVSEASAIVTRTISRPALAPDPVPPAEGRPFRGCPRPPAPD
jgi:hypothetical protein